MSRISCVLSAALTLGLLAGAAPRAEAYGYYSCEDDSRTTDAELAQKWISSRATFYARLSDFDRGPEESASRLPNTYRSVLDWVVREYSLAPHAFSTTLIYDDAESSFGNGFSEMRFEEDACGIGCAGARFDCDQGIIEADVDFAKITWTTSTLKAKHFPYASNKFFDFRAVAMHEFGHLIGLNHTATVYNLMGDQNRHSHTNGDFSLPYLGADDTNGLLAIYPQRSGALPELSVSHWRFTAPNGDYSAHRFESIYDENGGKTLTVGNLPGSEERLYTVRRGQVVMPEFTLENICPALPSSFETRYYISTDPEIGASDRLIATFRNQTVAAGAIKLYRNKVTIPTNTALNTTLYLGIIVDVLNQNNESHEDVFGNSAPPAFTGNATYIPITVIP
jgi:hypothetical protein